MKLSPSPRTRTWLHIILTTKDCMPRLPFKKRNKLFLFLISYCKREGICLDVINGRSDHVHLLLMMNPRHALAEVLDKLKEASEQYLKESYLWNKEFIAFSVSLNKIPSIRRQVLRQAKIHQTMSLEQELWELGPSGTIQECMIVGNVSGIDNRVL